MLEVRLLNHGRLVDVIVGGDTVIVGDLGQLLDILEVRPADVHVEEN